MKLLLVILASIPYALSSPPEGVGNRLDLHNRTIWDETEGEWSTVDDQTEWKDEDEDNLKSDY